MSGPWRPLLTGDAAVQALAAVREIADATSHGASHVPANVHPKAAPAWQNSLDGRAGQSLLHAYLYLHDKDDISAETAIRLLDEATDAAATLRLPPSLYFGFSGIGWIAAHLEGRLFEESEDNGREVDETLLHSLNRFPWEGKYDLFEGLVGLGVYALERLPRPSAASLLEAVVAHLAALAEHTPEGACFFNPPDSLPPKYRRNLFPKGTYNLGVPHGIAGVIALLGAVCHVGIATEQARPLVGESVRWLLARERPVESDFRFMNTYTAEADVDRGRLAWCHGDLGIAMALLMAARGAGEASWESEARRIAKAAAAHLPEDTRAPDVGLCHGAAGIGHLFNRLYQTTGEASLGEAARLWLFRALTLREPGVGVGGYRMVQEGEKFDHPGFRIGSSGVGLALLAAISPVEPDWDRLLLASLREIPATLRR